MTANINPKHTLESFATNPSNQFAHAVACAVADNPVTTYNPLIFHGGSGTGKTHLLHAIGNSIRKSKKHLAISYYSSEILAHELLDSPSQSKGDEFYHKLKKADVLLVDDVQHLACKKKLREGIFSYFKDLYEIGKQIVITSDKSMLELHAYDKKFCSFFEKGLVVEIHPPDSENK